MESSLRAYDDPVDRIRMHRQANSAPFLLVEGPGDVRVLRPHLKSDVVIFPQGGKRNVASVSGVLTGLDIHRFVCVVDRDFDLDDSDRFKQVEYLYYYEGRDLEAMLVALGVLADLLSHLGAERKLEVLGGSATLVDLLSKRVQGLTRLKIQNQRLGWGLPFDAVRLEPKINKDTLILDHLAYASALLSHAGEECTVGLEPLLGAEGGESDALDSSGKDMVAFAGVALRRMAGSLALAATRPEILVSTLHGSSAFSLSHSQWLRVLQDLLESLRAA